jgi:Chlorophyll A-B binding protein
MSFERFFLPRQKIRESELKHGRLAMVAFLGIMVGENFNPLFDGKISGPAIYQFQQADDLNSYFWVAILFGVALVEGQNILTGWESPRETTDRRPQGIAQLKDDYINGDLGFDPLGLTPTDSDEFDELRTKELNNGRLAMLGVAGIIAQELVNGKGVLENLNIKL